MKLSRAVVIILAVATALPIGAQEQPPAPAAPAPPETLVLPTEQVIDFETDEVTWMSVDVSPDGHTLVFDLLGDLYTLPIAGGTAKRIVGGMSFESQPTWAPDGRTIAFLSDRSGVENLWIADADGANPRANQQGSAHRRSPRRPWSRRRGRLTASTWSCRRRGRPIRARSGSTCTTATAATASASGPRRRRSRLRMPPGPAASAA